MPDLSIVVISKDEPALADTLVALADAEAEASYEIVVVDASEGRLDRVRTGHPHVRWIDYRRPPNKRITIPEQRNVGVRAAKADVVVFIDAGCLPQPGWLDRLAAPVLDGAEQVTVGLTTALHGDGLYDGLPVRDGYLDEAPTINLAFTRGAFDLVGGFDETFDYGSDVDFTWRLRHAGIRLRSVPTAVVRHDWGTARRQLKRAYRYGQARARLYAKHRAELRAGLRRDPILFAYPAFLLALPLSLWRPLRWLPALIVVPLWRARGNHPVLTVADHLAFGWGALTFALRGAQ